MVALAASCAPQKIAVTAHRGFWNCEEAGYAENSIKSLELAQQNGLWGSEFDVHITSDLVMLVHHDPDIDGMRIWNHDYADFKDCRLKNGEKIPTLDEYLAQGEKSKKTVLVFELKKQIDKAHEDYMVDQSVKALKEHGLYNPKRVIFISFSLNMCERLAALCPGFTVQYLDKDKSPEELAKLGINGVDYQYKVFGKNAELLIDHAWGREPCLISDIKGYKSKSKSVSFSQILPRDYSYDEAKTVIHEMALNGAAELMRRKIITSRVSIFVGYSHDEIPPTKGTAKLGVTTTLASFLTDAAVEVYEKTTNRSVPIRRLGIAFDNVCDEGCEGYDLFTDFDAVEREKTAQQTVIDIRQRFGKNAVLNGINLMPEGTQRERNTFIGGHRAGYDDKSGKS